MKFLFNTFLHNPLYNALVGLLDVIPGADIGVAVIILTIIVKLILFPLSATAVRTQIKMKEIDGELKEIREKYKDKREEMGKAMLELYRENKINPFASILTILIQLPIILALYFVFSRAGFPEINTEILYSFVPAPGQVNTNFLGFIDLTAGKNVLIALFAGVTQYIQMQVMMNNLNKKEDKSKSKEKSPMEDIAKTLQFQMKYIMPIVTFFISFGFVSVVGLYWTISNLFAIGQDVYVQKKIRGPLENRQ